MSPSLPAEGPAPRPNTQLLSALVREGVVSQADGEAAQVFARRRGLHLEEALIQMGTLDESQLLKFAANYYKTYFVSTRKLSTAPINEALLKLVTYKLARKLWIFPVKYDQRSGELSVLTVQPDDLDVLKNVQFATRVPKVRALVARPAAIEAAIRFHFQGEGAAFGNIRNHDSVTDPSGTATVDRARSKTLTYDQQSMAPVPRPAPSTPTGDISLPPMAPRPSHRTGAFDASVPPAPAVPPVPQVPQQFNQTVAQAVAPAPAAPPSYPFEATDVRPQMPFQPHSMPAQAVQMPPVEPAPPVEPSRAPEKAEAIPLHDYLETIGVFVALLENERGDLRGHSVQVARICRRLCERLGLKQEESDAIVVASYLHDVGKTSAFHLTALNVAEYEGHRTQAKKSYMTPVRIFESVRLPKGVVEILSHLYERFDGQGFPDRLTGKEIALGARVLAIVETYADLTGHAGNPYRKKLTSQEAYDALASYKGKVFDPNLVDVFKLVVLGDDLRAKLLADSRRALIVDPDAEETTVLDLRLSEHGYQVVIARNANDAENELTNDFDVVISEVDLKPIDGFELLKKVRANGNETPFVFLSKQAGSDVVQRGFDLGADEFITKPASPDVVALKVNRVLDGAGRKKKSGGVSGSLTEMALPDVVQILFHGRKSGRLTIMHDGRKGEILFSEGQIFDANFAGKEQDEAFYEMLSLTDGDFELDPNHRPTERVIQLNPESLLLEGMRRLDEAGR